MLPLLATVMFVSEVGRNHTAFHTTLMMLDLIEKSVKIDTSTSGRVEQHAVVTGNDQRDFCPDRHQGDSDGQGGRHSD